MDYADTIQTILIYALPVLFAITVHEAAHGYAARHFGDNTAAMMGRITLNPVKHIDPVGTILMPLLLYFATAGNFLFGYAKPVPVRFGNLRNPKRDMIWVALAGPLSNLLMALGWGIAIKAMVVTGVGDEFFVRMAYAGIVVNIALAVLNLMPVPPLDGGRILTSLLPLRLAIPYSRLEPYGIFILLALLATGLLGNVIGPLVDLGVGVLASILSL